MMKRLLKPLGVILALLVSHDNLFAQYDFVVHSPSTDKYGGLCYPIQTGKSVKVPITVKCNMTKEYQPYTVSINTDDLFNGYEGWFKIDNNSQTLAYNQTITFLLTITVPIGTSDNQPYYLPLSFNAYDSYSNNNPYTGQTLKVIVDNTPPAVPTVSVFSKTSSYDHFIQSFSELRRASNTLNQH